ncbi:MAG TPA: hypothetical protein VHI95_13075 [Acidimicrobiales bacterium]|nr:hypothetical protein [Acidimicrobiales bacterium]
MRLTRIALLAGCVALMVACSDKPDSAEPASSASSQSSPAPATFVSAVCSAVSTWQNRMVGAANSFSTDSPKLDVSGRRARYSRAFDDQKAITDDLRKDIEGAPAAGVAEAESIRTALVAATGDVQTTLRLNQADAASHPDSDYEFQAVKEDRLFAGTEKSLSQILKPLDEQSRVHDVPELGGTCGRT